MIDKAGVYELSMDEYHADPVVVPSLSSGIAHRIVSQSALHAWFAHPRLNPNYRSEEETKFDLGACAHALLLEGEEGIAEIDADDWRTKAAKEARAKARFEGRIPVLKHKVAECRAMAAVARVAIASCGDMKINLAAGMAERVLIWNDAPGVWCRARPDWMSADRKILLDYKSTAGVAEPDSWGRSISPMGYDMQSVHYQRGNEKTGGPSHSQFVFLVQENYAPFACSFVALSPAKQEIAMRKREFAVALWQSCMKQNVWKGYPKDIAYTEPSSFELDDDEDRRLTFEQRLEYAFA